MLGIQSFPFWGPAYFQLLLLLVSGSVSYNYIDMYQVCKSPPNIYQGVPLKKPSGNYLPAEFPNVAASSLRGNLILSRFAGQPMKNLAELARAVRRGVEAGGVEWKAFRVLFFVVFF